VNVFGWHVHGSWMTAFVHGPWTTHVAVNAARDRNGLGRARTYAWPDRAVEVTEDAARDLDVDLVLLQRPHELELAERWLGRRPGIDVPAVYVEHDAPQGRIADMRHPVADRPELLLVHVTHFNRLLWDSGSTPTAVVEHGIVDPGYRYTGDLAHQAVVVNEARRRGRVTGTDLLPRFAEAGPVDLFGMDAAALGGIEDLPHDRLHDEMAQRRVYVHPIRWTSLGLSLLEAMHLGMPVVALATTEVPRAVPPEAGCVSCDLDELVDAARRLLTDRRAARAAGEAAREAALARHGLGRFLADWGRILARRPVHRLVAARNG
jgi:glycosyltransferase involved in cell wall biosynthesis